MSTADLALTAHLDVDTRIPPNTILKQAQHQLRKQFGIVHCTLQLEIADADSPCIHHCDAHPHDHGHDHKHGHQH